MRIAMIVLLLSAIPLAAQTADPIIDQAKSLMNSDQDEKAVELLEKGVAAKPNDAVRHYWLANAYGNSAKNAGMFQMMSLAGKVGGEFERAVQLDPGFIDARLGLMEFKLKAPRVMGGSLDDARTQAAEIRKRDPMNGHRAFAEIAETGKDLNGARAEYAAAIRENSGSPKPHYWYGVFLMLAEKNYAVAADEIDASLRIDPAFMPARYQIGHIAALSGANLARGEEALLKYLALKTSEDGLPFYRAHYWLGVIYEKQGKPAEARSQFLAALRMRPSDDDAKQALRRVS